MVAILKPARFTPSPEPVAMLRIQHPDGLAETLFAFSDDMAFLEKSVRDEYPACTIINCDFFRGRRAHLQGDDHVIIIPPGQLLNNS